MELKFNEIPREFVEALPKGFRLVTRNRKQFLMVESLFCPHGHNIIVDCVRIHDEASIKIKVKINGSVGFIFIDAFWGSHSKLFSYIPDLGGKEAYVEACCPYCGVSMNDEFVCNHEGCDSRKSVLLTLPGGRDSIHICARLGCPGHQLRLHNMSASLAASVSAINFVGAAEEEVLGGYNELFAD